ncbi:MAG: GNAT family N-acetyltransferase [Streptosporangiaceae bacterium]|nr:GNAT family N-acetyltransferase [Streptosporangiaceae bacterium]MBV9855948.1 GNAT family N-acetyltransferase [Streptosporangiaceae bacterium]
MPAVAGDTSHSVIARVARRWRAIDPLLPPPGIPARRCPAGLIAAGGGTAFGTCEHWAASPGSLDLSWGAARRFELAPRIAGPDVAGPLEELLSRWRDHLRGVPGAGDEDTAALVTWPSRDIDGVTSLLRHGLVPLEVIAARRTSGEGAAATAGAAPETAGGVLVRRAGPSDMDEVVRLGVEVVRYDSHFGGVRMRPGTAGAMRRQVAGLLAGAEPWTWLAERDGTAIGLLAAQRPEAAGWISPMVGAGPAAYLMLMFVEPPDRGSGAADALTARFSREAASAGVAVTLLHYEMLNPRSGPFWSRQGYRPLWTVWDARPATALR